MITTIPTEYRKDLSVVEETILSINKTHRGLGDLAVINALCDIGNRSLLIIGISGTGKSKVAYWVKRHQKRNIIMPHGISVTGLKPFIEQLNQNSTSIIVEDLTRSGSDYMQVATVAVLAGLVYTGEITKSTATLFLNIQQMRGSALIFAQPLIMKKLVKVPEFESDISDKTLRYYHLYIPSEVHGDRSSDPFPYEMANKDSSNHKFESIDRVRIDFSQLAVSKYYDAIIDNFCKEVSKGRAIEHSTALMQASALYNGRKIVTEADAWLVLEISKNFRCEDEIYTKTELEGMRTLDPNILPLFTLLASFDEVTVKIVSQVFKLSEVRVYSILKDLGRWLILNNKHIYPTPETIKLMRQMGVSLKGEPQDKKNAKIMKEANEKADMIIEQHIKASASK